MEAGEETRWMVLDAGIWHLQVCLAAAMAAMGSGDSLLEGGEEDALPWSGCSHTSLCLYEMRSLLGTCAPWL